MSSACLISSKWLSINHKVNTKLSLNSVASKYTHGADLIRLGTFSNQNQTQGSNSVPL